jgi:thiamine biosynthesis lipoprotein
MSLRVPSGIRRSAFRAMGTEMAVVAPGSADSAVFERTVAAIRRTFEDLEQRFSRFRQDSELSEVNRAAGRLIRVSEPFAELLWKALDGARRTGGLFDPTVLPALVAAGYDRDFEEVRASAAGPSSPHAPPPGPAGRWHRVELRGNLLRLPPGTALDFGGIGKGWAADVASEHASVLPWAVIDAGGDLRFRGAPPSGGLDVALEDPEMPGTEILRLKLDSGALATSSVTHRRWGPRLHHIIDPRTGRPAITRVLQATAWAADCAEAEIRATWAVLAGPSVLDRIPAVICLEGGDVRVNLEPAEVATTAAG